MPKVIAGLPAAARRARMSAIFSAITSTVSPCIT
jgi:hypothetical protein